MTAIYDDPLTSSSPAIVGVYQNELVATPDDFPEPTMLYCTCDYHDIMMPNHDYDNGLCLISNIHCYQIEEAVFKVSLYGTIHRGWILQKSALSSTPLYHRSCHEFQIVVKKFRKVDVERLCKADDPIQEFSALQYIGNDHPHVLGQIACLYDHEYFYSVMKYIDGGELCSQILGIGPVAENKARGLFLQLLDALEFIQSKGIFHRDISLENILITKSDQLILIDFGMCLQIPLQEHSCSPYLLPPMPAKGKKSYMAPEIVSESTPFNGFKSDIWSLGIVLFTMLTGKFIVTHASPLCQLFRHVRNGRLKEMCVHWKLGLSEDVQSLLYDMLSVDPKKRPTISDIRKYSWCIANEIDGGMTAAAGA